MQLSGIYDPSASSVGTIERQQRLRHVPKEAANDPCKTSLRTETGNFRAGLAVRTAVHAVVHRNSAPSGNRPFSLGSKVSSKAIPSAPRTASRGVLCDEAGPKPG